MRAHTKIASMLICGLVGISHMPQAMADNAGPDSRDVVRSTAGAVVMDSRGNCVRTKWHAGSDACGAPPAAAPSIAPQPRAMARAEVAQQDRTVYFNFNQWSLTPASKEKLNTLANVLKSQADVKEARVFGYADRMGAADYNEKLSEKRAEVVRDYLISRGFANARNTETRWLGESAPVTQCPDSLSRNALIACLQKDRRVEVEIDYLPESTAQEQR